MGKTELRHLPAVDRLLKHASLSEAAARLPHDLLVEAARAELESVRRRVLADEAPLPSEEDIARAVARRLEAMTRPTLQPVINATGVIIHTNLGRALLSRRAQQAMQEAAAAYSNLEYDLPAGKRGSRYHHAEALLCRLTGAEAAVVVNNNAAALVLSLSALAREKEVLISRSQLIEIGGGFRIPDIMRQSGATLVEVGTTNRTYLRDYEDHLHTVNTALILRVHRSNFQIVGFTSEPSLAELVALGERYGIPVLNDLGSGTLLDTAPFGLAHEPTIQESIAAGVGLVTASGDKLLGGPQAGLILGRADLIGKLKRHPLIRAFRVDKITLAALQATLLAYVEEQATKEIPVWRMIAAEPESLRRRAETWRAALAGRGLSCRVVETVSAVGGGSLPGQQLPTHALSLRVPVPDRTAAQLRAAPLPVVARIEADQILFDPRTVLPEQDDTLLETVARVVDFLKNP